MENIFCFMHMQTHILSGWIAGNCFKLNARERFMCMVAAGIADIDGVSYVFGSEAFDDYHHLLGHNLLLCLIVASVITFLSRSRIKMFILSVFLFHLHLLMDFFGSGHCWKIFYWWPFSSRGYYTDHCWNFYSWQNIACGIIVIALTVLIIYWRRRTFLEYVMPELDRKIVKFFVRDNNGSGLPNASEEDGQNERGEAQ